jgi:hypothetical protein
MARISVITGMMVLNGVDILVSIVIPMVDMSVLYIIVGDNMIGYGLCILGMIICNHIIVSMKPKVRKLDKVYWV